MKKNQILSLLMILSFAFLTSCSDDDEDDGNLDCSTFEWSYEGDSAPDTWAVCNGDCGGMHQSPIDISNSTQDFDLTALSTSYNNVPIDIFNNGHTVEFSYAEGSALNLNGESFELLQFHFHTDSEHTVNGNHFPMECHLVHQNSASGALAVVSVLIEEGEENEFLATFSDNYPENEGDTFTSEALVNVEHLLPENGAYYNYSGSLTTPPCSEEVSWFVMKNPVQASSTQISNMHAILSDNYRPTQALNGRIITEFN